MQQVFTTREASRITGASLRQLQYWDETELVRPSFSPSTGSGHCRLYNFTDMVELRVLVEMRRFGLSLQRVRRGLEYLRFRLPDIGRPLRELVLETDGRTMFAVNVDGATVDTLDKGQAICRVSMGPIIAKLENALDQTATSTRTA